MPRRPPTRTASGPQAAPESAAAHLPAVAAVSPPRNPTVVDPDRPNDAASRDAAGATPPPGLAGDDAANTDPAHVTPHPDIARGDAVNTHATQPSFPPLAGDDPVERHRLSRRVIWYWRWRAAFSAAPLLVLLAGLAVVLPWGTWYLRWAVVGGYALVVLIGIVVLPPIRHRVFWYALSGREIDIQHGIIFIKRTVVPMHRVQNLRTERGPVADHYWFTNLTIKTAAGSVTLSGLDRVEADDLCNRISQLADVVDDV